ncbi:hypothetical protein ACA910_015628 [Epithemia clementina (nom. ined.)]
MLSSSLSRASLQVASASQTMARRALSTRGHTAASRLHDVLEEYRQVHYTQELPNRFKKDIVTAACIAKKSDGGVCLEGLQTVLRNIGLQDRLSPQELQILFEEEGNEGGAIPVDRMVQIL